MCMSTPCQWTELWLSAFQRRGGCTWLWTCRWHWGWCQSPRLPLGHWPCWHRTWCPHWRHLSREKHASYCIWSHHKRSGRKELFIPSLQRANRFVACTDSDCHEVVVERSCFISLGAPLPPRADGGKINKHDKLRHELRSWFPAANQRVQRDSQYERNGAGICVR